MLGQRPHQLVIIGNGFDLSCGLKSRYSDFYNERLYPLLNAVNFNPDHYATDFYRNELTAWDLIVTLLSPFHNPSENINWCDIEEALHSVLENESGDYECSIGANVESPTADGIIWSLKHFDVSNGSNSLVAHFLHFKYPVFNKSKPCVHDLYEVLLIELKELEHAFQKYLRSCQSKCASYKTASSSLLNTLLKIGCNDRRFDATVLNFNYTRPRLNRSDLNLSSVQYVNIHGKLDDEIIFGIDGTKILENSDLMPFTKTFRIFGSQSLGIKEAIARPASPSFLDPGTEIIKFFGHSLSHADYSYFQSVFDAIDLYSGSTELIFYYRPYKADAKLELEKSVVKLLYSYGSTMSNRDHGENLIHKLLLENRLSIQELT